MLTLFAFGRLTRDPEIRDTPKSCIANFSVACSVGLGKEQQVAYLDCKAWPPLSQIVEGLKKGDAVQVIGTMVSESWDAKDGTKRTKLVCWPTALIPQGSGLASHRKTAVETTPAVAAIDTSDDVPF